MTPASERQGPVKGTCDAAPLTWKHHEIAATREIRQRCPGRHCEQRTHGPGAEVGPACGRASEENGSTCWCGEPRGELQDIPDQHLIQTLDLNKERNEDDPDRPGINRSTDATPLPWRRQAMEAATRIGGAAGRSGAASPQSPQKEDEQSDSDSETATSTQSSILLPVITPDPADEII
ncbi:hypothetical protein NDU88_001790 [Pleurodeles waltl]|uniref:Uncharacterized protein n=1 Tax=Pleurodeles waltl TaxID=8319 RepID=A0AAV7R904_PLEWA|nr:hypothetical protein NDU88_001790 [Pleurodeles waltl]